MQMTHTKSSLAFRTIQIMQSPERNYIVDYKEDKEATKVDPHTAWSCDVHHLHVEVGGGAAEIGFDHGSVAIFQGGDPLLQGFKEQISKFCVSVRGREERGNEGESRTCINTYLNNPGRRKEQSRGDATKTKHASDTDIERAGKL